MNKTTFRHVIPCDNQKDIAFTGIEFFGQGWLAKKLYHQCKIDNIEEL